MGEMVKGLSAESQPLGLWLCYMTFCASFSPDAALFGLHRRAIIISPTRQRVHAHKARLLHSESQF